MTPTNSIPIFDGHNDTLLDLYHSNKGSPRSFFSQSDQGHLDLPRARKGGFGGGFFAIFTPTNGENDDDAASVDKALEISMAPAIDQAYAQQFTIALAAQLFRLEAEAEGQIKVVRTVDELTTCLDQGILATIFHIEGAEAIDPDKLDALYVLYQAGLRSLGIVWSRPNAFGCGVPFMFPHSPDIGPGLTDAGRNLVKVCNQLGILIDLSHLNEKGVWDVANLSDVPLVATHSGAYTLCNSPRNLTDKQLDAIKETGGVVGVNFHNGFLREDGQHDAETSLSEIVRHVNYMVDRMGIDHVALGSDFDGANMPQDLGDVAGLPKLMAALRDHDYDEAELRMIAHENWVRVLRQTWKSD
jgi:membrane dipeptidase